MARDNAAAHAPRRRTGRRIALTAAVAVLVAGAGAGAMALSAHGHASDPKPAAAPSARTVAIVRTDLSDSRSVTGTLGFGGGSPVKGAGKGLVTRLPEPGTTVARGKPLYWVDDRPVMVFFGDTPVFRELAKPGVTGRDVTVLAENLQALGYDTGPVRQHADGAELTPALAAALKRWQRDTGQQATGTLGIGQVAVLPGEVRVSAVKAQLGDEAAAGELLTVTPVAKVVSVKMDAADAEPVRKGDRVTITLPSTKTVPGKVTAVGQTVQGGADDDGSGEQAPPTLGITIVPTDPGTVKKLDSASVQVQFTTGTRKHVLVVPVGSLLALSEGGYALQSPEGKLRAVQTGLFAKGMVEISGPGISEGDRVVTTS
ncbi:peptidoglycan-binding protein [Streptomyces sp. NBC_01387]|uniref:peptidoglycan-binding protein n=1 Tax=unclassified Streptomyces TaxID=2593676 RepID=UPI002025B382|nr:MULTISPECIES: peptidoglycan-binding protein [unclassified Streptomyces]MCX4550689.1 peptidoglycan-binding protein [Streptomyces sp. NBC_01500]WSV55975.1 peptidoglycan-binding protein [Streptomyces sp. NBC_01014]